MRKWEYKVINTLQSGCPLSGIGMYHEQFQNGLNDIGRDGWELCSIASHHLFFKREVQDASTTKQEEYEDIKRQAKQCAPEILADLFNELAKAARNKTLPQNEPGDAGPSTVTANH